MTKWPQPDLTDNDKRVMREYISILRWFDCDDLPPDLQAVIEPFRCVAWHLANTVVFGTETDTALRKLLEAKDAAVRSSMATKECNDMFKR